MLKCGTEILTKFKVAINLLRIFLLSALKKLVELKDSDNISIYDCLALTLKICPGNISPSLFLSSTLIVPHKIVSIDVYLSTKNPLKTLRSLESGNE